MKKILKVFILFFIAISLNNCASGFLGIPDAFKGYYQSNSPILDEETYLIIYIATGSLTIYLSDNGDTNITSNNRKEYASISPYNIVGLDYNYTFENGSMNGSVNFNGMDGADVKVSQYNPPFTIKTYCKKVS